MINNTKNPFENKEVSNAYSETDPVYKKSAECIVEFQAPTIFGDDSIVIDLGAGTGVSSEVLLNNGAKKLILVDPSRAMLEAAELKLGDKVKYLCADAENFCVDFLGTVDLIYALNSIHLFPNLTAALASIGYALKRGGLFVFNISAPTFSFNAISSEELKLIKANLEFYSKLNEIVNNPILEHTVMLLNKTLKKECDLQYTREKFIELFKYINFEFSEYSEVIIELDSSYQKNIWSMMGQSFTEEGELISKIIDSIPLNQTIHVRQALFKFKNNNVAVV
jgi:SAM-dependent methyltransferase